MIHQRNITTFFNQLTHGEQQNVFFQQDSATAHTANISMKSWVTCLTSRYWMFRKMLIIYKYFIVENTYLQIVNSYILCISFILPAFAVIFHLWHFLFVWNSFLLLYLLIVSILIYFLLSPQSTILKNILNQWQCNCGNWRLCDFY